MVVALGSILGVLLFMVASGLLLCAVCFGFRLMIFGFRSWALWISHKQR